MRTSALFSAAKIVKENKKRNVFSSLPQKTYKKLSEAIVSNGLALNIGFSQDILNNFAFGRLFSGAGKFPSTVKDADVIIDVNKLQLGYNKPRRLPYASGWELFKGSFFGRDSARIAQDRLSYDPAFTKDVILSLAALQGTSWNELSEEEPGKIHHEWRSDTINGHVVPEKQKAIIRELGPVMGGTERAFTSYVSADATLAFLETVHLYLEKTKDMSILDCEYYDKDATSDKDLAHQHTLKFAVEKATQWVADTITCGPLHYNKSKKSLPADAPRLFSWQHVNEKGVHNQTLRDSEESEFHPNGEKANHNAPRVDTGMQGVAYDVLKKGGKLLHRTDWKNLARVLQTAVLQQLWMPEKNYFVQGLDYNPRTGNLRQIKTLCANAGELLNSAILLDLPKNSSKRYITGIVTMLFSNEFLTTYGIRTQGIGHINALQVTMPDGTTARISGYHGPETVWPVINGKIIDGLEHVGLYGLAENIKIRISNVFRIVGHHAEFVNVGEKEQLGIHQEMPKWGVFDESYQFHGTNTPELIQGWSWSLHERVQYEFSNHKKRVTDQTTWQSILEGDLLKQYSIKSIHSAREVKKLRSKTVISSINVIYGRTVQQQLFQKWGSKDMYQLYT